MNSVVDIYQQEMLSTMADSAWDRQFALYEMIEAMRNNDYSSLDDIAQVWEYMKKEVELARRIKPFIYNNLKAIYE